jgi:hypothetical protein
MPSFSIVIPTRNRPDLAAAALASAAWQDSSDVEIILSDNSTDPAAVAACRAAVESLRDDPRVRYIRPPTPLAMPDHWEFATRHATGEYLLILTDRFVMRPGALSFLQSVIVSQAHGPPEILMWKGEAGYSASGSFSETSYQGTVRTRSSDEVLEEFARAIQWRSTLLGSNSLPRGLNSAVRREIIEQVRKQYGRAYAAVAPDYTSAFHQLVVASRQVELDAPLYVSHGGVSNGAAAMRDGLAVYAGEFGLDPFENCPLPIDTVVNITVRDYLWVALTTGADMPPIDPVGYLLINYRELQLKRELGSALDIPRMRRAILSAAAALGPAERAAFAAGRAIIDARETPSYRLRNFLAKAGWLAFAKKLVTAAGLHDRQTGPRYHDVLEAARAVPLRLPFGGRAISSQMESSDDWEIAADQEPGAVEPMQSDPRPL